MAFGKGRALLAEMDRRRDGSFRVEEVLDDLGITKTKDRLKAVSHVLQVRIDTIMSLYENHARPGFLRKPSQAAAEVVEVALLYYSPPVYNIQNAKENPEAILGLFEEHWVGFTAVDKMLADLSRDPSKYDPDVMSVAVDNRFNNRGFDPNGIKEIKIFDGDVYIKSR